MIIISFNQLMIGWTPP